MAEKVKLSGVIFDEDLDLKWDWMYRMGKARSLVGSLGGVGNSRWGMNLVS